MPVHVADGLSVAQVRAYRLADNRTHEEAAWNPEMLGLELQELGGLDVDVALTGFEPGEVVSFIAKIERLDEGEYDGADD